jgi:hypothetical protein
MSSIDEARRLLEQPAFTIRPLHDSLVEAHGWPTASNDTLATGTDAIFVRCECVQGGVR